MTIDVVMVRSPMASGGKESVRRCRGCNAALPSDPTDGEVWALYCPECGLPCPSATAPWAIQTSDKRILGLRSADEVSLAVDASIVSPIDVVFPPEGEEVVVADMLSAQHVAEDKLTSVARPGELFRFLGQGKKLERRGVVNAAEQAPFTPHRASDEITISHRERANSLPGQHRQAAGAISPKTLSPPPPPVSERRPIRSQQQRSSAPISRPSISPATMQAVDRLLERPARERPNRSKMRTFTESSPLVSEPARAVARRRARSTQVAQRSRAPASAVQNAPPATEQSAPPAPPTLEKKEENQLSLPRGLPMYVFILAALLVLGLGAAFAFREGPSAIMAPVAETFALATQRTAETSGSIAQLAEARAVSDLEREVNLLEAKLASSPKNQELLLASAHAAIQWADQEWLSFLAESATMKSHTELAGLTKESLHHRVNKALWAARRYHDVAPHSSEALILRFNSLRIAGRLDEADALKEGIKALPIAAERDYALALLALSQPGELAPSTVNQLQRLAQLKAAPGNLAAALVLAHVRTGGLEKASQQLDRLHLLVPSHPAAKNLSRLLEHRQKLRATEQSRAEEHERIQPAKKPHVPSLGELLSVAQQHEEAGRFKRASSLYHYVLARDSSNCPALSGLASLALVSGFSDLAASYLEAAAREGRSCFEARIVQGDRAWAAAERDNARHWYQLAQDQSSGPLPKRVLDRLSQHSSPR